MSELTFFPMPVGIVVVSAAQLAAVYALLGSASPAAIATSRTGPTSSTGNPPPPPANAGGLSATADTGASPANTTSGTETSGSSDGTTTSGSATSGASPSENDGKTDAAGTVFDPARHTGTVVKSGLWRMKTGLSRPENEGENSPTYVKPGDDAPAKQTPPPPPGAKPAPPPPPPSAPAVDPNRPTDPAFIHDQGDGTELWYVDGAWDSGHPVPTASAGVSAAADEDDEFAAFATAAKEPEATVRSWTDADLSKLCNQAATKDGNPLRVKPIIAKFVPAGEIEHSKNIPQAKREEFAREVETTIGITYEG